jgi:NAD(P)-dependent dehydrogenase (short-subunit alcohol dehydrogenase family)
MDWSEQAVPDLTGRVIVITGANTGIGFEAARVLAARGAAVVLACRSEPRALAAKERILARKPPGSVDTVPLDLASLASVESAAAVLLARDEPIDLLINNAGVMDTPYSRTVDGFERQLGTNHLGHYAFTGRLLPKLLAAPGSRIVNVSSLVHRRGAIDFDDLVYENGYTPDKAYCRSKLANLLYTFELQRRLEAAGASTVALAAHPGIARSELMRYDPIPIRLLIGLLSPLVMQSAAKGALPTLRAATDPEARGGQFFGPDGRKEQKGSPVLVEPSDAARDEQSWARLWTESEKLTGVTYPV